MLIAFPLTLDEHSGKVVRDQDGQYILEAADEEVASMVVACVNLVVSMPDPPDDWSEEVN